MIDFFTARIRYFAIVHHLRLYIVIDKRWFFTLFAGINFEFGNSQRIHGAHFNDMLRYVIIIIIFYHLSSAWLILFSFWFASLSITFKFSLKSKNNFTILFYFSDFNTYSAWLMFPSIKNYQFIYFSSTNFKSISKTLSKKY